MSKTKEQKYFWWGGGNKRMKWKKTFILFFENFFGFNFIKNDFFYN